MEGGVKTFKKISFFGKNKSAHFIDNQESRKIVKEIYDAEVYYRDFGKRKFTISPKDTVIDIGANIGIFSVSAAKLAYNGKVYAFEPVSENFELLTYHKKINHLDNLQVNKLAVSDHEKEVEIWLCDKNLAGHSMYKNKLQIEEKELSEKCEKVKCVSLKDIFEKNNIERCNFLKIDCEGEEYKILRALPEEYFQKIEKIALEYHQVEGESCWDLVDFLNERNYFVGVYHWRKNFGMMYAYKKTLK